MAIKGKLGNKVEDRLEVQVKGIRRRLSIAQAEMDRIKNYKKGKMESEDAAEGLQDYLCG